MFLRLIMTVGFLAFSGTLFGQQPAQPPAVGYKDSFQVDYLDVTGYIYATNAGSHSVPSSPVRSGDICVNAYVFSPITDSPDGPLGAKLTSCCSCRVAPNTVGTITPTLSGPVVVKLVATLPVAGTGCDATVIPSGNLGAPAGYASGMQAWSVSQPTVLSTQLSTSKFTRLPLSRTEQANIAQLCAASTASCTCQ